MLYAVHYCEVCDALYLENDFDEDIDLCKECANVISV